MSTTIRIAVIGGGAKAAAICAKAASLRDVHGIDIQITVFERDEIGAHWSGGHGYTDGAQRLCTAAERDVGFPYSHDGFGARVAADMQARFSWAAFMVATERYADWVDMGRHRPSHAEFAEYLNFCITRSGAEIVHGDATFLEYSDDSWTVSYMDGIRWSFEARADFDGVVITGIGPADSKIPSKIEDERVLDGETFWQSCATLPDVMAGNEDQIVIIGSGGTAAATAGWLVRAGIRQQITILGTQATLYARADSAFENRAFRDLDVWKKLSYGDRLDFTNRLTRGAVWTTALDALNGARNVVYQPGRAQAVRYDPVGDPNGEILVEFTTSSNPTSRQYLAASLVVDATGFDPFWFAKMLPSVWQHEVLGDKPRMQSAMSDSMELPLTGCRGLHAPMLSQIVSPSYSSLMALGAMSDALLKPYFEAISP